MRINGPSGSGSEGASSKGVENHDPATPPAAGVPLRGAGDGVRATILAAVTAEPPATMMGRGSIVDGDLSITSSADLAQLAEVEVIKGDLYIDGADSAFGHDSVRVADRHGPYDSVPGEVEDRTERMRAIVNRRAFGAPPFLPGIRIHQHVRDRMQVVGFGVKDRA